MGEQFLRKQAHGFRHRHDAAFSRLKAPNLITSSIPDVMTRDCRCSGTPYADRPAPGSSVILRRSNATVDVLSGARVVGRVDLGDAAHLSKALDIGSDMLRARVERCSSVANSFVVRLEETP